jgi:hypothetical protein
MSKNTSVSIRGAWNGNKSTDLFFLVKAGSESTQLLHASAPAFAHPRQGGVPECMHLTLYRLLDARVSYRLWAFGSNRKDLPAPGTSDSCSNHRSVSNESGT